MTVCCSPGGIIKLIAQEGDTTTLGAKGPVKLENPPAARPVNLKNLSLCPLSEAMHSEHDLKEH